MSLAIAEIRMIPRFLRVWVGLSIMLSRVRVPPGVSGSFRATSDGSTWLQPVQRGRSLSSSGAQRWVSAGGSAQAGSGVRTGILAHAVEEERVDGRESFAERLELDHSPVIAHPQHVGHGILALEVRQHPSRVVLVPARVTGDPPAIAEPDQLSAILGLHRRFRHAQ